MTISSEDSPPSPPSVDDEHEHILRYQPELFGLVPTVELPDSNSTHTMSSPFSLGQRGESRLRERSGELTTAIKITFAQANGNPDAAR